MPRSSCTAVDGDAAYAVVAQFDAAGWRAAAQCGPVARRGRHGHVATAVRGYGRLDALFIKAAVLRDRSFVKMTDVDFDAVADTYLQGPFTCSHPQRPVARAGRLAGW